MYQWLDQLRTGGEAAQKAFVRQAHRAHREWLCGERMTLSVTADVLDPSFETLFGALRKGVSFSGEEVCTLPMENTLEKEIIRVPSGVSYAASTGHLARYGQEADGAHGVGGERGVGDDGDAVQIVLAGSACGRVQNMMVDGAVPGLKVPLINPGGYH